MLSMMVKILEGIFAFSLFLWFNIVYIYNSVEVNMIFGSTVGYDSIYSYPYESRKITVQEMMENIPLYDSEKGKSSNEKTKNRKVCDITESESKIVKALYSKINSKIDSYIQKIMNKYEYEGSPVYSDDGITRETLAQIINQVMDEMKKDFDDVEEIILEFEGYEDFSRNNILNMLVEALVLNEIFLTRRPKYRRIRDNYVFVNGIYSGIRRR
jgi:hypothetical protein